jgi:hypothetical protein
MGDIRKPSEPLSGTLQDSDGGDLDQLGSEGAVDHVQERAGRTVVPEVLAVQSSGVVVRKRSHTNATEASVCTQLNEVLTRRRIRLIM